MIRIHVQKKKVVNKRSGTVPFLSAICVLIVTLAGSIGCNSDPGSSSQENHENESAIKTVETYNAGSANRTPNEEGQSSASTLILTVNTRPVYWPEFLFWLNYIGKYYKKVQGYDEIKDWNVEQNGMNLSEFFLSCAVGYASKDRAIEAKAEEMGITLSEDDLAEIEKNRINNIMIYGSEMEYRRIVSSMYISEEVFNYLTKLDYLGNYLFEHLYGANAEKCSDEDISTFIEKEGYLCAKYIFLSNLDAEGNYLSAEKRKEKYELLEQILGRLDASDSPMDLFDELIKEYGEDMAISMYPDGRLLVSGTMGEEFGDAYYKLEDNEYSDIVETDDGCYILLRTPIDPSMRADPTGNSLRYWVAYELFKGQVEDWSSEMEIRYEEAYYEIDVKELLG